MLTAYLGAPYSYKTKSKEIGLSKPNYSDEKEQVEEERYHLINQAVARLYENGITVISPITQSHPLAKEHGLGEKGLDFWLSHDYNLIMRADLLLVLMIEGWKDSEGLQQEIQFCQSKGIPILYVSLTNNQIVLGG